MGLWTAKLKWTFGGRAARDINNNELLFFIDAEPGDPRFKVLGGKIGNAFQPLVLPRVRMIGIVFSPALAPDMVRGDDHHTIPIGLSMAGTRAGAGMDEAIPAQSDFVARFEKNASYGRAGRIDLRGVYTAAEESTGDDLGPATIPNIDHPALPAFGAQLLNAFTSTDATLALPAANKKNWDTAWRPVTNIAYTGAAERQLTRAFISIKAAKHKLFLRHVHEIQKYVNRTLKMGVLALAGGAALLELGKMVFDLVAMYGWQEVLAYAWRTEVLPFIRHFNLTGN